MLELQQGRGLTYFRGHPLHRIAHPSHEVGVLLGDVPGHPSRSVRGHLRMLCAATGVPARRADEVLEAVGLVSLCEERLGTLSHGMDRRLGLACALLPDPHALVLDEPTAGLPAREAYWLHRMLRAHAAQGGTVLFTTADPKEAARAADRVVTLKTGRLVADQGAGEFARTRLRPRVAVRSPHAARLAAVLGKEARTAHRSVEVVREGGNRLSVYGSTTAEVGETAFRHGILVHQLAHETGDMGPGAGAEPSLEETGDTRSAPETVWREPAHAGRDHAGQDHDDQDRGEPTAVDEARPTGERRPGASEGERTTVDGARPASPRRTVAEMPAAGRQEAPRTDRGRDAETPAVAPQPRAELGRSQPAAAPSPVQQSRTADRDPRRSTPAVAADPSGTAGPRPSAAAEPVGDPAVTSLPATPDTELSTSVRPADQLPAPATAKPSTAPALAKPSVSLGSAEPSGHAGSTRTAPAVPAQPPAAMSTQPLNRAVSGEAPAAQSPPVHAAPATPTAPTTAQPPARALPVEAPGAQPSARAVSAAAAGGESPIRAVPADASTGRAPARSGPADGPDPLSPLPPPITVRPAPRPLRPVRYELRRAAGIGAGFLTCGAVLLVSALTAVLLARVGHTPQARLFAAWPRELPLPPAALGAGLLGALAFGDEFRHPALAADRGTVPRRLGLLTAKLLVSGATAVLLSFLTVGCDAEVLYLVYGRELAQVPADWLLLTTSWFGLIVGCAWAGVLAAGVFRSTTAGLAAVLAVPVLVVPVVHKAVQGTGVRMAAGLPVRMRETFLLKWPFGGERYLVGSARVLAQPVAGALALSLVALLCAYLFSTLRARVR
ncbi:hypothetical protein GCM10011578_020750 [Streptomyces fuscichromogenes]|uniref:ABC transporter domain-containing protein n=2 Tax=Streptomyces fuscichromogenes TaxID=1324013 RepID=A0A917XA12_9ACTN|nr:hypothetical protein GCM10011578_020750 [Streptomyces fuscichromogenes]